MIEGRLLRRVRQVGRGALVAGATMAGTGAASGCSSPSVLEFPPAPKPVVFRLTESTVDKIDLLLMIDNSRSMADKQVILGATVPDLVSGLVNPSCIDFLGLPAAQQPQGPLDPCPDPATRRRFHPIVDIHVGIITSSLGGHGSDACAAAETFACPGGATNTSNADMGHLLSRTDPCAAGSVPTYQNKGFLAWDPASKLSPPGEKNLGAVHFDPTTGQLVEDAPGLVPDLEALVRGAGQIGCGYESQLESWYRFLVDPAPYQSIAPDANGNATPQGVDAVLLQQRKDFLRSSSLLAIIGLTDENDCSIRESGQFYFVAQQRDPANPNKNFHLPKARSECATNPNDKCCLSCVQSQAGCPVDPVCATGPLDAKSDDVNLRCWDQKRRFGIDFLYPIDRYVTGLTSATVPDRMGNLVANPIFTDLDPTDADSRVRDPSLVLVAYVTGVPWQDIAVNPKDLGKGFKSAAQLATPDAMGHTTWDYVIGDPDNFVKPLDPHMIESITPRSGTDPITGVTLAPTTAPAGTDAINGHEYTPGTINGVQGAPDDLEYACVFDLPKPRDCSDPNIVSCDCQDPQNDNPLCEPDPSKGGNRTLQVRAKAYPGIRELQLVKALGAQGIVGSICPAQLANPSKADFGYRPAIQAVLARLTPAVDGTCLPRPFKPDENGQLACTILEARNTGMHLASKACDAFCSSQPGRVPVSAADAAMVTAALSDPAAAVSGWDCVCKVPQLGGAPSPGCTTASQATSPLGACQCDPVEAPQLGGKSVDGWCYVDTGTSPTTGNPAIVQDCPAAEKRIVRFVGAGNAANGATLFIACPDPDL
jgi:hypothetical protein